MRIQECPHESSSIPSIEFLLRQRIEERIGNDNLTLENVRQTSGRRLTAYHPGNGCTAASDDDLFAALYPRQELRKLRFRLVDVVYTHWSQPSFSTLS